MSIASILSEKDGTVVTMTPDQSISDAARLLAEKRIGAVVITDEQGGVSGILSERDIVKGLATSGPSVLTRTVGDLMTTEVSSCTRSETIDGVMRTMTEGRFRHMPVVESGQLVGVISIGDVVKHRIKDLQHEAEALRDYVMS